MEKEVLETPVVFFDTAGCEFFERVDGDGDEGSRCNENEATIVDKWVDSLVGHFYDCLLSTPLFLTCTWNRSTPVSRQVKLRL